MEKKLQHFKAIWTFIFLLPFTGYGQTYLEVEAFEKELAKQANPQILDTRSTTNFEKGHLKYAYNLDFEAAAFRERCEKYFPKEKEIFLLAGTSRTTENAAIFLKDLGYTKIFALKGGFTAWIQASKSYVSAFSNGRLALYSQENLVRIASKAPATIFFLKTPSCGYCKKMQPEISRFATQKGLQFLPIDIELNEQIAEDYHVSSTPTMLLYKGNRQVWRGEGEYSISALEKVLQTYF